jgi:hypothetical protein
MEGAEYTALGVATGGPRWTVRCPAAACGSQHRWLLY